MTQSLPDSGWTAQPPNRDAASSVAARGFKLRSRRNWAWDEALDRRRSRMATARRMLTSEPTLAGAGLLLLVVVAVWRLLGAVELHLTPDAAHALADADALLGRGVRPIQYLPGFPALVALPAVILGPVAGVQVALAAAYLALGVALYLLCRQFVSPRSAFVGTGVGLVMPALAELLAWAGGATLLATAWLVFALVALERWIRTRHGGWALVTGGALSLCLMTHPFVAVVAVITLATRWFAELWAERRGSLGWGPFGARGLAIAGLPLAAVGAWMVPRYLQIQAPTNAALRPPELEGLVELMAWATRESEVLILLVLGSVIVAALSGRRAASITLALVVVFLVVSTSLGGDPTYRSRVVYLIPLSTAIGAAIAWHALERRLWVSPLRTRRARALFLVAPLLAVWAVGALGFNERLAVAPPFYQRLSQGDLAVMDALRAQPGDLTATSWAQNAYGEGLPNSWLVEGLAGHRAAGPTNPALSTITEQRVVGSEMQQLFAGQVGVQNEGVQIAFGPAAGRADPAIAVEMGGFLHPVLYVSSPADDVGLGSPLLNTEYSVDASGGTVLNRDARGQPMVETEVTLDGNEITVTHRLVNESADSDAWSLWLWPAYGVGWHDIEADSSRVSFAARPFVGGFSTVDDQARISVAVDQDVELVYHEHEIRYDVQALEVRASDVTEVTLRITVDGVDLDGRNEVFDERTILDRRQVSHVVVWRDTGWLERFEGLPCYRRQESGPRIVLFEVASACRGGR